MKKWSDELFRFYNQLQPTPLLPNGIEWLYPQAHQQVMEVFQSFLNKYFHDKNQRLLLLGINPGRLGAGVTGVNFTAPKQLAQACGIEHPFKQQTELSAEFIYEMIEAYGGASAFYADHFIGSVCPLGFIKEGKNINYYDDKALLKTVEPFIKKSLDDLMALNFSREKCVCIGGEKNYKYLSSLNEKYRWFDRIISVPHPRFIMQYRRKEKAQYLQQYLQALTTA